MQSFRIDRNQLSDISQLLDRVDATKSVELVESKEPLLNNQPHERWLFNKSESIEYSIEELLSDYGTLEELETQLRNQSVNAKKEEEEEKEKKRRAIEVAKLVIQLAALHSLFPFEQPTAAPPAKSNFFSLTNILYSMLLISGTAIAIFQGIDGVNSLFSILGIATSASNLVFLFFVAGSALLSVILFCSFDLEFLNKQLDAPSEEIKNELSIYEKEIDTIKAVEKHLLLHSDNYSAEEFDHYIQLYRKFNARITTINSNIPLYQESATRKILRYVTLTGGTIITVGDTLYTVVGVIGSAFSATPLGLIILSVLAVGAAAFFIASYRDMVYDKINSTASQMNRTHDKAERYCNKNKLALLERKLVAKKEQEQQKTENVLLKEKVQNQDTKLLEFLRQSTQRNNTPPQETKEEGKQRPKVKAELYTELSPTMWQTKALLRRNSAPSLSTNYSNSSTPFRLNGAI